MVTSVDTGLHASATVRSTNSLTTEASARIRSDEPDFDSVATAIRSFLRHDFAEYLMGNDDVPGKLSSYSGKGVGHYQTAADGRADWSSGFKKYIFERTDTGNFKALEFSMQQFQVAMKALERDHPRWHEATMLYDVQAMTIQEVAGKLKVHPHTIHRYRKSTAHYLYPLLLGYENAPRRSLHVIYRRVEY